MQKLADQYKDRGLEVIGITSLSKGGTMDALDQFMKEAGARFPVAHDSERRLYRAYSVGSFPDMALIKDGKVVFKGHPGKLSEADLLSYLP